MPNELFQNALSTSNSLSSQAQVSGGIFPNLLDARLTDLVGDRFSPNLQDRSQSRSSSTLDQAMITGWASSSDKVTVADADDLPSSAIAYKNCPSLWRCTLPHRDSPRNPAVLGQGGIGAAMQRSGVAKVLRYDGCGRDPPATHRNNSLT